MDQWINGVIILDYALLNILNDVKWITKLCGIAVY